MRETETISLLAQVLVKLMTVLHHPQVHLSSSPWTC